MTASITLDASTLADLLVKAAVSRKHLALADAQALLAEARLHDYAQAPSAGCCGIAVALSTPHPPTARGGPA